METFNHLVYFHELSVKYILNLENCYSLKVLGHCDECWYILYVCIQYIHEAGAVCKNSEWVKQLFNSDSAKY